MPRNQMPRRGSAGRSRAHTITMILMMKAEVVEVAPTAEIIYMSIIITYILREILQRKRHSIYVKILDCLKASLKWKR